MAECATVAPGIPVGCAMTVKSPTCTCKLQPIRADLSAAGPLDSTSTAQFIPSPADSTVAPAAAATVGAPLSVGATDATDASTRMLRRPDTGASASPRPCGIKQGACPTHAVTSMPQSAPCADAVADAFPRPPRPQTSTPALSPLTTTAAVSRDDDAEVPSRAIATRSSLACDEGTPDMAISASLTSTPTCKRASARPASAMRSTRKAGFQTRPFGSGTVPRKARPQVRPQGTYRATVTGINGGLPSGGTWLDLCDLLRRVDCCGGTSADGLPGRTVTCSPSNDSSVADVAAPLTRRRLQVTRCKATLTRHPANERVVTAENAKVELRRIT